MHILFKFRKAIARQVMPEKAWAYYSSAADDEITIRENHAAYHRYVPHRIIGKDGSYQNLQNMVSATNTDWCDESRLVNNGLRAPL